MKNYTLHLREIRVVPVEIQANSLEEAKELLREGEGDFQNDRNYPSNLSVDDILDNVFETGFVDGKKIHWKELNA